MTPTSTALATRRPTGPSCALSSSSDGGTSPECSDLELDMDEDCLCADNCEEEDKLEAEAEEEDWSFPL